MYTPTQSPSSDAEPPLKHQVKNNILMQEVNSMDSEAEESSRENQLAQEILQLQKENKNLRALNISLQQKILPMLESINQDPRINQTPQENSSQKSPNEKMGNMSKKMIRRRDSIMQCSVKL